MAYKERWRGGEHRTCVFMFRHKSHFWSLQHEMLSGICAQILYFFKNSYLWWIIPFSAGFASLTFPIVSSPFSTWGLFWLFTWSPKNLDRRQNRFTMFPQIAEENNDPPIARAQTNLCKILMLILYSLSSLLYFVQMYFVNILYLHIILAL